MVKLELLKVQLPQKPLLVWNTWHYNLLAMFHKTITFIRCPHDNEWTVLCDNHLRPGKYVDAVFTTSWYDGTPQHIYAVIGPRGDMLVWDPFTWGESWCHIACK